MTSKAVEQLRASAKTKFPQMVELLKRIRQWQSEFVSTEQVFSGLHHDNGWDGTESVSGPGSTLNQTEMLRAELPALLQSVGATSLIDAPCGDFHWMKEVELGVDSYLGIDIVRQLIENNQRVYGKPNRNFVHLDITKDDMPKADVILCRDCLVHLSYKAIYAALQNFKRSGAKYLLTTFHPETQENMNIVTGGWRALNLLLEPFNFPEPTRVIRDGPLLARSGTSDKHLGLWNLNDLLTVGDAL